MPHTRQGGPYPPVGVRTALDVHDIDTPSQLLRAASAFLSRAARSAGAVTCSRPKPSSTVRSVVTAPYVWKRAAVGVQSFRTAGLPGGGPVTLQAPREVSKPSVWVAVPPTTSEASSARTPWPPVPGSVM